MTANSDTEPAQNRPSHKQLGMMSTIVQRHQLLCLCASYSALFAAICLLVQLAVGAYRSDHSQAGDEAAHFVSSLMIAQYLAHHLFTNPLTFAKEYYAHFPRVGLGHYPPMFETVQAAMFLVFGQRGTTAVALQAVIGGVCAGLPAAIVSRLGIVLGVVTGIAVLCAPSVLFLISTVMTDNFLAVLVTLTALAWTWFYFRRTWSSALVFSLLAAAAILTKGTAFGLAVMPAFYLFLKKDLRFLFQKKTIASAAVVAIIAIPWYVATYRLTAAGFYYHWGWTYTRLAIPYFLRSFAGSFGVPIIACYITGLWFALSSRTPKPPIDVDVFIATSVAMLIIPMIVPADLSERYVIPALPSAAIVAAWGLHEALRRFSLSHDERLLLGSSLCAAIVLLSTASVARKPHLEPFHADQIASDILAAGKRNPLVLVSGSTSLEGAVIAAFAERDRRWSHYVVRGTGVLASGDFIGTNYAERFQTPKEMARWIRDNEIGWIVLQRSKLDDTFAHTRALASALDSHLLAARLVAAVRNNRTGGSELFLYALAAVDKSPSKSDEIFAELKPSHPL